jgi:T5orf172 domain
VTGGCIYLAKNDSMPGIYKIGMCAAPTARERLERLSRLTSIPTPFKLLWSEGTEKPRASEKMAHLFLRNFRVSNRREFFQCPVELALTALLVAPRLFDGRSSVEDGIKEIEDSFAKHVLGLAS